MRLKSELNPYSCIPETIEEFEDLKDHLDLVERLQKSFYFKYDCVDDELLTNISLPLTEASVNMFEKVMKKFNHSNEPNSKTKLNKFNMKYATKISRKACISPLCFILALIYIERLKKNNQSYLKSTSPCDLFLVSLIISSKFLYERGVDEEIFNSEWATISRKDIRKLNEMELEFLDAINWNAHVGPVEFVEEWVKLENLVIKNECKKRLFKFITYTEIMRFLQNDKFYQKLVFNFLTNIGKFMFLASFTYLSAIVSLILLSKPSFDPYNLNDSTINNSIYSDYNLLHNEIIKNHPELKLDNFYKTENIDAINLDNKLLYQMKEIKFENIQDLNKVINLNKLYQSKQKNHNSQNLVFSPLQPNNLLNMNLDNENNCFYHNSKLYFKKLIKLLPKDTNINSKKKFKNYLVKPRLNSLYLNYNYPIIK